MQELLFHKPQKTNIGEKSICESSIFRAQFLNGSKPLKTKQNQTKKGLMEQYKCEVLNNLFLVNGFCSLLFSDVDFVFPLKEKFMDMSISFNRPYCF